MITKIEAVNYRSLRKISQRLSPFQILVGANATGKTTFLDVVSFMSDIVNKGVDTAIRARANNYTDLTFAQKGGNIELAIELAIPHNLISKLGENKDMHFVRYELCIGIVEAEEEAAIISENLYLLKTDSPNTILKTRIDFPENPNEFHSILINDNSKTNKKVLTKEFGGNDSYYPEMNKHSSSGWLPSFKLGPKKSALGNLPADEEKFPVSVWIKETLEQEIQMLVLNSLKIRQASPPNQGKRFLPDGSNLPWMIDILKKGFEKKFKRWIAHIQTALPDIIDIEVIERADDKHKYIKVDYGNGIKVPSWLVSDGTLRLLALTILAYLPDFKGIYLIEEPENGIHPKALETLYQSLSSVYDAQILIATHSPVFLSIAEPKDILCFAKTNSGITDIVRGDEHPKLKDWKGELNISVLFASGVLD
jgi:predicted ATPase